MCRTIPVFSSTKSINHTVNQEQMGYFVLLHHPSLIGSLHEFNIDDRANSIGSYYEEPLPIRHYPLTILFLIAHFLLLAYEMLQAYTLRIEYIIDISNSVDLLRSCLCVIWGVLSYHYAASELYPLTWSMAVINYLKGFTAIKISRRVLFYTKLIIQALKDSVIFMIIFFYSLIALGTIFFISNHNSYTAFDFINSSYALSFGSIDMDEFAEYELAFPTFTVALIVNFIIMLNLLISILSNTFDSFQANRKEILLRQMAQSILEIEIIMFWKRNCNDRGTSRRAKK